MKINDNIFELFTSPKDLFCKINNDENLSLINSLIVLLIVNTFFVTSNFLFTQSNIAKYLVKLVFSSIGSVILWYVAGMFFEFVANLFNNAGKLKQIMSCFAYSLCPLLLFSSLQLLKPMGQTGYFLAVIFEIIIYFWSIYLMAKSIEITYNLTFSRAVMVILLPVICSCVFVFGLIEFISKMIYIFKI